MPYTRLSTTSDFSSLIKSKSSESWLKSEIKLLLSQKLKTIKHLIGLSPTIALSAISKNSKRKNLEQQESNNSISLTSMLLPTLVVVATVVIAVAIVAIVEEVVVVVEVAKAMLTVLAMGIVRVMEQVVVARVEEIDDT